MLSRLKDIEAIAHPAGNRIDLTWVNPHQDTFPGVRVVRRENTYPTSPHPGMASEGIVIAHIDPDMPLPSGVIQNAAGKYVLRDEGLHGETVYYYGLFPFPLGNPPIYQFDLNNRAAAVTTSSYNMAGIMYDLLPRIYHRYDTTLPTSEFTSSLSSLDSGRGQLRRFLDLPGGQLDQLQSFTSRLVQLYNLEKSEGRLLPWLAQWIGWKTDHTQEVDAQRNEIRHAPFLYQTTGLIPTVEATIKRTTGWESRTKEFIHNVFVTNQPPRLNLWLKERNTDGDWTTPSKPLSLDFAYEGRPAVIQESGDGPLWIFYHTFKKHHWEIWHKTFNQQDGWSPSSPLVKQGALQKDPTAVIQNNTVWVFWGEYDETTNQWQLKQRTRNGATWSESIDVFSDTSIERKCPVAVVDSFDGIWLFWQEKVIDRWMLKYNRFNGGVWQLDAPMDFPLDGGTEPRVDGDLFALFRPGDPAQRIWLFWARKDSTGDEEQTRWSIVYRVKGTLNPTDLDWSPIRTLPKPDLNVHDREPAVRIDQDGNLEMFWSSDREGSWSIWSGTLDIAAHTWTGIDEIIDPPFAQRAPFPMTVSDQTFLFYRSNKHLVYTSNVYRATTTFDERYAGSNTVHTRDVVKTALRGSFDDFQHYTYDAGTNGQRNNDDWYGRDTIGLYLSPDTLDPTRVQGGISRIEKVLGEFMPMTDRAVFITQSDIHTDQLYSYNQIEEAEANFIGESFQDIVLSTIGGNGLEADEDFSDELET